jgi:hypothetical protein
LSLKKIMNGYEDVEFETFKQDADWDWFWLTFTKISVEYLYEILFKSIPRMS